MNITIHGTGYVGLVTGLGLANLGHAVCCHDIDQNKIDLLNKGVCTIYEEGLDNLLSDNLAANRICFTTDLMQSIQHSNIHFIAVGTPPDTQGNADISSVIHIAKSIIDCSKQGALLIIKSTVPPGTAQKLEETLGVEIVSNPEFLREGVALQDFFSPSRILIGSKVNAHINTLRDIYKPLIDRGAPFIVMDNASAELSKYAANVFLATKVSLINEMSQIAEVTGANIKDVKQGIGLDPRIGLDFLNAGCGFGGSCFPKDITALKHLAEANGLKPDIINSVLQQNEQHQLLLSNKIKAYFKETLPNKTIAIWGLAFKPGTDDIRNATSLKLIDKLLQEGCKIQAYDPLVMDKVAELYPENPNITFTNTKEEALINADSLAIVTEWEVFKSADPMKIKELLNQAIIFDGRNIYDCVKFEQLGIAYYGIGYGKSQRLHHLKT